MQPSEARPLPEPKVAEAHVAHLLPGRVRLRVPSRRGDMEFFEAAAEWLGRTPSIGSVQVNPRTASIVMRYAGPLEPILEEARAWLRVIDRTPAAPRRRRRTEISVSPMSLTAAGFVALAAFQLARGRLAGSASEHLWNAYIALRQFGRPGVAAAFAGIGVVQVARGRVLGPAATLMSYAINANRMARGK